MAFPTKVRFVKHGFTCAALTFTCYLCDISDLLDGYKAIEISSEEHSKVERSLRAQCQAVSHPPRLRAAQ